MSINKGGGIFNKEYLTLENVSISDNNVVKSTQTIGGGIYSQTGSTLIMNNCTLSRNEVSATIPNGGTQVFGGAIFTARILQLTNCTFT